MIALHALPVSVVVDLRPALRDELARLDRLRDRVATELTIENFKHHIKTSPPADVFALIDRPVDPPLQLPGYAGLFEDQGAREARLRPAWTHGPPSRFTPAQLEAAYFATPPPRSGPRVATTLRLGTKAFFYQLHRHGLSLRGLHAQAKGHVHE